MAHNISNEYKQIIYSGDARNKIKILFNNVELEDADRYCEKLTVKSRIIPNGAKIFNLNNFISKEADLILHDIDTSIIQNQVSISIGTLVGNSYEYVPIGIFNIENQPTNDKNKTTIKLRDNSVKFDFNYNAQPLIEQNGGVATKLQILQDICSQAGVTCNITSFVGYLDEIGVYDNTITAREYISRLAEQAGRIATINRSGELIFVDLNNLTTWEIPIEVVEKYENGTKFKIGRVVYEDGIVRYETPTSNDDTLFLDGSNNYINGKLVKEQASSSNNAYSLENTGDSELAYLEIEGKTTQETRQGYNLLLSINSGSSNSTVSNGNITFDFSVNQDTYRFVSFKKEVGKTYTLSFDGSGLASGESISFTLEGSGTTYFQFKNGKNAWVITTSRDNNQFTIDDVNRDNITSTITLSNIMILEGSYTEQTLPTYEKYGLMPSPEFPSELVSVGYENLFNWNNPREITLIKSTNRTITATPSGALTLEAGTYTISLPDLQISNNNYNLGVELVGVIGGGTLTKNYRTFTINEEKTLQYLYIYLNSSDNDNATATFSKILLIEGTQTHSYIPYGKYGIEVKTNGKNMIDYSMINTPNLQDNGYYKIAFPAHKQILNEAFKENTQYTISFNGYRTAIESGNAGGFNIYYTDGVYDAIRVSTTNPSFKSLTSRVNKTISYIDATWGSTNETYIKDLQLEEGTQATTPEEYKLNTYLYTIDNPLRSIGDTKDLLYIKNGMLYVERKIGKLVLDGSETDWNNQSGIYDTANRMMFSHNCSSDIQENMANRKGLSNYFVNYPSTVQNANVDVTAFNFHQNINYSKYIYFKIEKSVLPSQDVAGFKSWLSIHNTEVQYELAEPYTEELGQVQLPNTYKSVTHININSNINTNSYLQYRQNKTQLEAILQNTNQFSIDSLKTGKILGNPAIDSYDLIQIHDKSRNLLGIPDVNYSGYGITIKSTNGVITISGTTTETLVYDFNLISPISSSLGTLTKSLNASGTFSGLQTSLRNNGGNSVGLWTDNARSSTNTISADAYKFRIQINSGITINTTFKPQIEVGNVETDYVPFKDETYTTLATNDLVYTGVLINTFDTQIGEEAKEQNVFVNGEETFKKWARTTIDNVEGSINLQAGQINEANGRINETNLRIDKDGALLNVIANNSNIDIDYDSAGNPISGEVREVTTTTGFTFNAEGMTIEDTSSNFKAQHRNTGTYYKDGDTIVGQYTKDGSKQKDLDLFGVYTYGKNDINDTPMFIAQLFTDGNGEECFGHFYNRGD